MRKTKGRLCCRESLGTGTPDFPLELVLFPGIGRGIGFGLFGPGSIGGGLAGSGGDGPGSMGSVGLPVEPPMPPPPDFPGRPGPVARATLVGSSPPNGLARPELGSGAGEDPPLARATSAEPCPVPPALAVVESEPGFSPVTPPGSGTLMMGLVGTDQPASNPPDPSPAALVATTRWLWPTSPKDSFSWKLATTIGCAFTRD